MAFKAVWSIGLHFVLDSVAQSGTAATERDLLFGDGQAKTFSYQVL